MNNHELQQLRNDGQDEVADLIEQLQAENARLAEHCEELDLYKSEHERLKSELNEILHDKGETPKAPSFCDLVGYCRTIKLDALNDLLSNHKISVHRGRDTYDEMVRVSSIKEIISLTKQAEELK